MCVCVGYLVQKGLVVPTSTHENHWTVSQLKLFVQSVFPALVQCHHMLVQYHHMLVQYHYMLVQYHHMFVQYHHMLVQYYHML